MTASAETAQLPGGTTVLVKIADRIAWVTMNRTERRMSARESFPRATPINSAPDAPTPPA